MGDNTQEAIKGRLGALFAVVGLQTYTIILMTLLQYEDELKVFNRERHDNIISVLPYFMSVVLISLPFAVILPIIFASIFYWMSGLRPEWDSFLWFTLTVGLGQYVAESFGFMLMSLTRSFPSAALVGNSFISFWTLCMGYLINPSSFIIYLQIVGYTSYMQYTYSGMVLVELKGNTYSCPYVNSTTACLAFEGDEILGQQHLIFNNLWQCLVVLLSMATIFRLTSLILLYVIKKSPTA